MLIIYFIHFYFRFRSLAGEIAKLDERRLRIKDGNKMYIDMHPELRPLIDDFISAIITNKPNDIIKYGAEYFQKMRAGGISPAPLVVSGPPGAGRTTIINILASKFSHILQIPIKVGFCDHIYYYISISIY